MNPRALSLLLITLLSPLAQALTVPVEILPEQTRGGVLLSGHGWQSAEPGVELIEGKIGRIPVTRAIVDGEPGRQEIKLVSPAPKKGATLPVPAHLRSLLADGATEFHPAPIAKSVQPPVNLGDYRAAFNSDGGIISVPLATIGTTDLRFNHHGTVLSILDQNSTRALVFAVRRQTLSDVTDSVFVTANAGSPSPIVATRAAFLTLSAMGTEAEMPRIIRHNPNLVYDRTAITVPGDRFIIHGAQPGTPRNVAIPFVDTPTSTTFRLDLELQGRNATIGLSPDHYSSFSLEGAATPQTTWTGRTFHNVGWDLTIPTVSGDLNFVHSIPTGTPPLVAPYNGTDFQGLDAIVVSYTAKPEMPTSGKLWLDVPVSTAPRRVTVGKIADPTAIMVLDVSNPVAPVRLTSIPTFADGAQQAIEFEAPAGTTRYLIQTTATATSSTVTARALLPALPSRLEGIVVHAPTYTAAMAPFFTLRGAGHVSLDPQAAYDAFNGGQEGPEAINLAFRWLCSAAPDVATLPSFLLVGHTSFDRRNYLGFHSVPQIPCYVEESVVQAGGVVSEDPEDAEYALLDDLDALPDALLGRLPVRSAAEITTILNRQIAYEAILPTLQEEPDRGAMIIADEDLTFHDDVADWMNFWLATGRPVRDLYVDPVTESGGMDGVAERAIIESYLEAPAGLAYLMYMGHGNFDRWSGHRIVRTQDVPTFDTVDRWPFVATYTCLNTQYATINAATRSLGEAFLINANVGAHGFIGPCGVDYYTPQRQFAISTMELIAQPEASRPTTVGELLASARIGMLTVAPSLEKTSRIYIHFGDPLSPTGFIDGPARVEAWKMY
jgi:hypothetical protein